MNWPLMRYSVTMAQNSGELSQPLTFVAEQTNSTVRLYKTNSSAPAISLEYSKNNGAWSDYSLGTTITLSNVGDRCCMRAKNENATIGSPSGYHQFVMTGKIKAAGNIQTLLKKDGSRLDVPSYGFYCLFYACQSLTSAPEMPATTLASYCYTNMFDNCQSLTTAPALPATTLAECCYYCMFTACTSLTTAPALPATTLASWCYASMFQACRSLTKAPSLPATTLASSCYRFMFNFCTSLTQAPELPATTLAQECYYGIFGNCYSLINIPIKMLPVTTLVNDCYKSMFVNCSSLTSAPELPAMTLTNNCYQQMFSGCSSLTTTPELSATELANSCYQQMFQNCTSLTQAPVISAITLADSSCKQMFNGCSKLNHIDINFTEWNPSNATQQWLSSVAYYGTFTCPDELPLSARSWNTIPAAWEKYSPPVPVDPTAVANPLCFTAQEANSTVRLDNIGGSKPLYLQKSTDGANWSTYTAGETLSLPTVGSKAYLRAEYLNDKGTGMATNTYHNFVMTGKVAASGNIQSLLGTNTLSNTYCFANLFNGCSSLTQAPELCATAIKGTYAYRNMFAGCTSLTSAPELPATTLASGCYQSMFLGCTSLTTAPTTLPATALAAQCYYDMFNSCTSLTSAPALPAMTLTRNCYRHMFYGCTSLKDAPAISATNINYALALSEMFSGCSQLSSTTVAFTAWPTALRTTNWLSGVAQTGEFRCPTALGTDETITRGVSYCPDDWTVVNY